MFAALMMWPIANAVHAAAGQAETVVITYQVKSGQEQALAAVIARHWTVARRLKLVRSTPPHVVLQGGSAGRRYIVEVLTWRDGSVPDAAPEQILGIWQQMEQLVEARDGRPGIDISAVQVLTR